MMFDIFSNDDSTLVESDAATADIVRSAQDMDVGTLEGAAGSRSVIPVQTDTTPSSSASLVQLLGSAPTIARDVGAAVGTAQRDLAGIGPAFNQARNSTSSGNSLATWWQYASTTDKLMVGLAIVGIVVALRGDL